MYTAQVVGDRARHTSMATQPRQRARVYGGCTYLLNTHGVGYGRREGGADGQEVEAGAGWEVKGGRHGEGGG
jgi:hypothetical protein